MSKLEQTPSRLLGVERVRDQESYIPQRFLTVRELAELLRLTPGWVYDHADELGAFRLGKYLRFDLSRVMARLNTDLTNKSQ